MSCAFYLLHYLIRVHGFCLLMWPRWFPFPHFLIIKIMNTYCRNLGRHRKVKVKATHCACLFATPWTIACQTPLPTELSRQEYWSGLPFPSPEDIPNPDIKPRSPALQADSLPSEPLGKSKNTGVAYPVLAYPFSRGSSRSRNPTWVFCIAGGFFTSWVILSDKNVFLLPSYYVTKVLSFLPLLHYKNNEYLF